MVCNVVVISWLDNVPAVCKVHIKDGSAQTLAHATTMRQKLLLKLAISPNSSILTLDQPVLALTL